MRVEWKAHGPSFPSSFVLPRPVPGVLPLLCTWGTEAQMGWQLPETPRHNQAASLSVLFTLTGEGLLGGAQCRRSPSCQVHALLLPF